MPEVLWNMRYAQRMPPSPLNSGPLATDEHVIVLLPMSTDVVLGDSVLEGVKEAWLRITGE